MSYLLKLIQITFYLLFAIILYGILFSPIILTVYLIIRAIKKHKKKPRKYYTYDGYNPFEEQQNNTNNNSENESYTKKQEFFKHYPYKKKKLLTQTEYHFYQILREECEERNLLICPKVRMEDYIDVTTRAEKQKYRGYIKSRHIDFLICDNELNILAGLELDDKSHNTTKAQKTDSLKDDIYKNINIPLMRVNVASGKYREQIINILNYLVNQS